MEYKPDTAWQDDVFVRVSKKELDQILEENKVLKVNNRSLRIERDHFKRMVGNSQKKAVTEILARD